MGKQHVHTGGYSKCQDPTHLVSLSRCSKTELQKLILKYLSLAYSALESSYLPIVIVVIVLILSLFLPNKVTKYNDLEEMKKVLDHMTKEVDRAEIACLTAANDVQHLQSSICNEETETEIAIMSIVYTDSFDSKNRLAGIETIM